MQSHTWAKGPGKSWLSRTIGLQALEHIGGQLTHSQSRLPSLYSEFEQNTCFLSLNSANVKTTFC